MLKWKRVRKYVNKLEDAICNRCGYTCMKAGEYYGLSAEVSGGYESTHLGDMISYKFDLCEKCLSELFDTFKIKPDISSGGI